MGNKKILNQNIVIKTKNDKRLVQRYLSCLWSDGVHTYKSTCYAALREARELTGRDPDTGRILYEEKTGCWSGACTYLILIEHIGGFFTPGSDKNNWASFENCFKEFSNLEHNEYKAIISLRNSFLHKFNLYNIDTKHDNNYLFSVNRDPVNLIKDADEKWHGEMNDLKDSNEIGRHITIISLRRLGDIAEEIYINVFKKLHENKLQMTIPNDISLERFLKLNTIKYN